jgi:hypothetical protein
MAFAFLPGATRFHPGVRTMLTISRRATLGAFLLFALSLSGPTHALIPPCSLTGVTSLQPWHPGPDDFVGYSVSVYPTTLGNYPFMFSKGTVSLASSTILIEVLLSSKDRALAGYTPVTRFQFDGPFATIAPLPVGSYAVTSTVRRVNETNGLIELECPPRDPITYVVSVLPGMTAKAPVVEFYNATLDHYFLTQSPAEISLLDAGIAWSRTGQSFLAYVPGQADGRGQGIKRYYGLPAAGLDSHLFTWSRLEPKNSDHWLFEGANVFQIDIPDRLTGTCAGQTTPVFRLWNGRADSAHRYTTSPAIKQAMIAAGYVPEGCGPDSVVMCAPNS